MADILNSFIKLRDYCEAEQYKGWDPYDGLNSKLFNAIPFLNKSAICRLVMIQAFKRLPFNLRRLAIIPKQHNAKGIGLFLQGYCNLYRAVERRPELSVALGNLEKLKAKINEVAELLISLQSPGYSGACWGYNFPWQCRREFLFPSGTPTVVATNFCATALFEAYEITQIEKYKDIALTSAQFVLKDLHRAKAKEGFIFSYSKLPGNDTVYNASLLGSRVLSYCYKYSGNEKYKEMARQSVIACCEAQAEDGSWAYGSLPVQSWIDSFHTGYNLDGLIAYEELTGDTTFHDNIEKGLKFYIENFFMQDGSPKYYHNKQYPIDIHCPGQLFVSLSRLHKYDEHRQLIEKVKNWVIANMQSPKGYFYYQLKPGWSSKISYMRWSNAFMFCSLSYCILQD
ncbi:MAG: delta-aminolevulinic acid dehydratase [Muribaculaceae bacterium]|nr:delta-aminolevulinic acid dehydratase [Muribaculaceae bacterium]